MDFNIPNRKQRNSHQSLQTRAFRTLFEVSVFLLRASLLVRFCCAFCRLCQIVDVRAFRCIVLAAMRRLAAVTAIVANAEGESNEFEKKKGVIPYRLSKRARLSKSQNRY